MEGLVRERLNIYYLVDTSASMQGAKIEQLNTCMQNLKPALEDAGLENNVEIVVRAIEFGDYVKWNTGSAAQGVPIENFVWANLSADGRYTPTAQAIDMVADSLNPEFLGKRTLRPVIILITDGYCNDPRMNYSQACRKLASKIKGNATRIAIAVESSNMSELVEFATKGRIGEEDNKPFVFTAKDAHTMTEIIRWASVVSIGSSIKHSNGQEASAIAIPDEGIEGDWIY